MKKDIFIPSTSTAAAPYTLSEDTPAAGTEVTVSVSGFLLLTQDAREHRDEAQVRNSKKMGRS